MSTTEFQPRVIDRLFATASSGGPPYVTSNSNTMRIYGATVKRTTISNPSWRIQIAKKVDAGVAYLVERQSIKPVTVEATCRGVKTQLGNSSDCYYRGAGTLPTSFVAYGNDDSLRDLALTRLKRKLKTRVGGAEALVPVAESRELRGLVRGMAQKTTTMVETLIDIKRTKGASALKYASDAWLTYGFGIRPLVDDTKKVSEAIGNYLDRGDSGIRDAATAKKDWVTYIKYGPYTGCNGADLRNDCTLYHSLSYRYYCGGVTTVNSSNDYTLAKHLGFKAEALIPAFWELVPYSWVVDYFTTVGAYLEDVFWIFPGIYHYSGYTRRYECKIFSNVYYQPWTDFVVSSSSAVATFIRSEFQRVPIGGTLPHIGLRWKSIDEVGIFGVTKLLNLASVLIQRKL